MQVQACKATVELRTTTSHVEYVTMNVVLTKELANQKPLDWMLLTTEPVETFEDAMTVIGSYSTRWRIEQFHRAWKSGVCRVEDTQLRGSQAIVKWATILGAVAARATRLTYLAREQPDRPALEEFSRHEIDAIIALREPKAVKRGAKPTLAEAVRWIADLGGYTGKSSGGPPGPTVIGRGLLQVVAAARAIKNMTKM
jgi:hypothetical protein